MNHRFDLEVHLVHQAPNGKTAVIGILYEIGHSDPFLSMVILLFDLLIFKVIFDSYVDKLMGAVEL